MRRSRYEQFVYKFYQSAKLAVTPIKRFDHFTLVINSMLNKQSCQKIVANKAVITGQAAVFAMFDRLFDGR